MKKSGPLLVFWYVLAIAFLFAPIAASIIYSFNVGSLGKQTSTFTGWTASWFIDAWSNGSLRQSMLTSLKASFWSGSRATSIRRSHLAARSNRLACSVMIPSSVRITTPFC